jgi:hypothetical protein
VELKNKVADSGLITINPQDFLPLGEIKEFDLKDFLFMGMILKEKDYRQALKELDWSTYQGAHVAVHCSADAIIPVWAYMLCTTYLQSVALSVHQGNLAETKHTLILNNIDRFDWSSYQDALIVIKGCGDEAITPHIYTAITYQLLAFAKSIMYGEPCSTVPIYKKKKSVV